MNTVVVLCSLPVPDIVYVQPVDSWQSLTRLFSAAAAGAAAVIGDPLDPFHGIQMRLDVAWAAWES